MSEENRGEARTLIGETSRVPAVGPDLTGTYPQPGLQEAA